MIGNLETPYPSLFFDYSARMLSTGDFFAAKKTGRKVARTETKMETPRINAILIGPKFKSCIETALTSDLFRKKQTINDPTEARIKQMSAMMNASA